MRLRHSGSFDASRRTTSLYRRKRRSGQNRRLAVFPAVLRFFILVCNGFAADWPKPEIPLMPISNPEPPDSGWLDISKFGWWWKRLGDVSLLQWLYASSSLTAIFSIWARATQWGYLPIALVAFNVFAVLFVVFVGIKLLGAIQNRPLFTTTRQITPLPSNIPAALSESDKQCLQTLAEFILGPLLSAELRLIGAFHTLRNERREKWMICLYSSIERSCLGWIQNSIPSRRP
jgi:hypothetical protein